MLRCECRQLTRPPLANFGRVMEVLTIDHKPNEPAGKKRILEACEKVYQ